MDTLTLTTVMERYVARRVNLRPSSASLIAYTLSALNRYAGREVALRDCTEDFLCEWLRHRVATSAQSTAKRDRGNVVTLRRFAYSQMWITTLPTVTTVRRERKIPTAWTMQEVGDLLSAARQLAGQMRDLPISRSWWYTTFLLFLYDSGLRVQSSLSLQSRDVWLDRRVAKVGAASDKSWSDRVVSLSPQLCQLMDCGMGSRSLVWPYPWHPRKLWLDLGQIRKSAGLPNGRQFGFHCMRRTHATQAVIASGWESARRSLGHTSEQMTRVYVDQAQVQDCDQIELPRPELRTV